MSTTRRRQARVALVVSVGALPLLLAACGSNDSGGSAGSLPKTMVFSPLSLQPPALKGLAEGLQGYAKSKGWDVVVQDPNFDATKQTQDLASVIDSHRAGAIWAIAVQPESMGQTIKDAKDKGIPILVNGTPQIYGYDGAQPGVIFSYIDYAAGGKALGEQLGKCLTEKGDSDGQVLFNVSTAGQAGKAEFEQAAQDALKAAAPGASIVQSLPVSDRTQGQTDIGNALQGHPDIAGVMSSTDEGALGAAGAFDAAGKTLDCNVDFGGNDEVLADVKSGSIYASVALQFQQDLTQDFDALEAMQSDPSAVGKVLVTPQKIITSGS